MRKPNTRFLAFWFLAAILLAVTAHFVHAYQTKRNSGILLEKARQLKQDGKFGDAVAYYGRYVRLTPQDTDGLAEYGIALSEHTNAHGQALLILEQVLRREPNYPNARRKLVNSAMASGHFTDAAVHLRDHLLKSDPKDGELWNLLGQCQEAEKQNERAVESYERAITNSPTHWEHYVRQALVLREGLKQPTQADGIMDKMIASNPKSAAAYHARGRYHADYGDPAKALADAKQSIELDEKEVVYLLFGTVAAQSANDLATAKDFCERAKKLDPRDPQVYLLTYQVAERSNEKEHALNALQEGLVALPENPDLLWELTNLYLERKEIELAEQILKRVRRATLEPYLVAYLEGRLRLAKGDWLAATSTFEDTRNKLPDRPDLQKRLDFWLGICYEQIGNLDLRLSAFRRALEQDSQWQPAKLGLASSLVAAGRIEESLEIYRQILASPNAPGVVWQEIARLLVLQQLGRQKESRDWIAVEKALDRAQETDPASTMVPILRAEMLVARGQAPQAVTLLEQTVAANPKAVQLRVAQAALAARIGETRLARDLIVTATTELGDSVDLKLERIRQATLLETAEAKAALEDLQMNLAEQALDDRFRLARQLAGAYAAIGSASEAETLWHSIIEWRPDYLPAYLYLFDAAIQRNAQDELTKLLDQIRRIEKRENGPLWSYGESARLLILAAKGDKSQLRSARKLLEDVRLQRPGWSRVLLMLAQVEELDGNLVAATDRYLTALQLGERSPLLVRRLVVLLFQRQRFQEADQVLRRLEEQQAPFSGDLGRLASEVSWRVEDYSRAIELAQKAAKQSKDPNDQLWLGQLLSLNRRNDEAEEAYRHATQIAPKESRVWLALIQHNVRTKQLDKIPALLKSAEKQLAPEQASLISGQAAELLENPTDAERHYRQALKLSPDDAKVLARCAEFFSRHSRSAEAEQIYRRMLNAKIECSTEERATARRQLAALYAKGREYPRLRQALSLIEENERSEVRTDDDLRVKAMILGTLPGNDSRQQGIGILEKLVQRDLPNAHDRFLLSQLYEMDHQWPQARKQLQSLLASGEQQPLYLATYVRGALIHDDPAEAEIWLAQLEKIRPEDATTRDLRARLEVARNRSDDAVKLVESRVNASEDPDQALAGAQLLEGLSLIGKSNEAPLVAAAEKLYRKVAEKDAGKTFALAEFLGRRGQIDAALDICLKTAASKDETALLITAISIVNQKQATKAQRTRVEESVQAAIKNQRNPSLLIALGTLYEAEERFTDAITAYEQAQEVNPTDVISLNNSALLYNWRGESDRASQLIEEAIKRAGPIAALLDTRGTIQLSRGKVEEAIKDLSAATADAPSPVRLYHLAQAQFRAGQSDSAKQTYAEAIKTGFKPADLHPLEVSAYEILHKQISP
jgi:cellulose synthase operon protein C